MSFIDYNSDNNSISIVKASKKFKDDYEFIEADGNNFRRIEKNGDFIGVEILDFLSKLELQGRVAEDIFKVLLDNNRVPYLYIGQGPVGIEYSEALKNISKSKRPDFLINIPDIGVLFVDVKCRKKIGFSRSEEKFCQLFTSEIQSLINLYEQILIPVWLAFYDESSVETQELKFKMIPISVLKRYIEGLAENLTDREWCLISSLRIPNELLYEINENLVFKAGISEIEQDIIDNFSNLHRGLVRRIEDEIKSIIRKEHVLKSKISDKVIEEVGIGIFFRAEVELVLRKLIEEGTVLYAPKKPLSLLGEQ